MHSMLLLYAQNHHDALYDEGVLVPFKYLRVHAEFTCEKFCVKPMLFGACESRCL